VLLANTKEYMNTGEQTFTGGRSRGAHAGLQRVFIRHHFWSVLLCFRLFLLHSSAATAAALPHARCFCDSTRVDIAMPVGAECAGVGAVGNLYCLGAYKDNGAEDAKSAASYVSIIYSVTHP